MAFENIVLEKQNRIATITLNRPEKLNAMSSSLLAELEEALTDIENDRSVHVVIIKGAGKAFSVGYDVDPQTPGQQRGKLDIASDRRRLNKNVSKWLHIWKLNKPVIAQIHGYCIAGANHLASMCDIVVVAEDATIAPRATTGPLGIAMSAPLWCHLVGIRKTKELINNIGKTISGKEAEQLGWANKAVPIDKLDEEVQKMAAQIAETPLDILEIQKLMVNRYAEMSGLLEALDFAVDLDAFSHFTPPVQQFSRMIQERGLKQARADWKKEIN
jgi:enoyl-CoA hydratase